MPKTTTLHVEGMHCNGCVNMVRDVLEEDVAGVTKAEVSLTDHVVTITHDGTDLALAAKVLADNGYTLVLPDRE